MVKLFDIIEKAQEKKEISQKEHNEILKEGNNDIIGWYLEAILKGTSLNDIKKSRFIINNENGTETATAILYGAKCFITYDETAPFAIETVRICK